MPDVHDLLLDELEDDDERCWCRRTPEECAEAGGCRWTRALTDRERQVRAKVAEEMRTAAATGDYNAAEYGSHENIFELADVIENYRGGS